jgi:hypothetical protein
MTARSTTRSLVSVLLVLSLCAPALAIAARATDSATEFSALAVPSSAVLLTRVAAWHDHVRQRPSAPSLCPLAPLHGGDCHPISLAAAMERQAPVPLLTASPRTGRSPPSIS